MSKMNMRRQSDRIYFHDFWIIFNYAQGKYRESRKMRQINQQL